MTCYEKEMNEAYERLEAVRDMYEANNVYIDALMKPDCYGEVEVLQLEMINRAEAYQERLLKELKGLQELYDYYEGLQQEYEGECTDEVPCTVYVEQCRWG